VRQPAANQPTRYTYDGANRLRRVERGGSRIDYLYDYNGRLLERARTTGTATHRARFVYANRVVLADLDAGDQLVTVYTRTDSGRLLRRRSASALVPAPGTDPNSLLYVHDGLSSVARLVDMDGSARLSVSYDAWGKATSSGQAVGDRFRYRGAFQDGDTELLLFGRRWYDPALGRWLSQDPILADVLAARRDSASAALDITNLYLYVGNNPLNLVDPSGLSIYDWFEWFKTTLPGRVLVEAIKWKEVDPKTLEPKGTMPERVEKKNPVDPNEDEAADAPEEFEPGAGEGSRSPSSERTYSKLARSAGGGGGGAQYVLAGGAAALVVVAAAPVEAAAAIVFGVGATLAWVFD
jgi:RHS repeat-associated protein